MKIVFINIDKEKITDMSLDCKYVIIASNEESLCKVKDLKVKPIVILYNGAYVVDLENDNVIINKPIDNSSYKKIIDYASTHDVQTVIHKKNNVIYEIKMMTNNFHRRLIIPILLKDVVPDVNSITVNKEIFVTCKNISIYKAIEMVLEYLNISSNLIELENICMDVNENGCYKSLYWKGSIIYES